MKTARAITSFGTLVSAAVFSVPVVAGGGPENVALIVNDDSWASKTIANEYAALWDIPDGNIIHLDNVPNFETIDVNQFRERVLTPIFDEIGVRHLADQIDYIVYSSDFPYAVRVKPDVGERTLPQALTPTASINGLTYLHALVRAKDPSYLGLGVNAYQRGAVRPRDTAPWTPDAREKYGEAVQMLQQRRLAEAEPIFADVTSAHPNFNQGWYNFACCLALMNQRDAAMRALARAVEAGWSNADHTASDDDLKSLRERADFKNLLASMRRPHVYAIAPSRGFRASYGWSKQGDGAPPNTSRRYMLSTMLAVTAGRGTSVTESINRLRASRQADGSQPEGVFYFMKNANVRSTTRQWGFATAVAALRELGHRAEIHNGPTVPQDRHDIAGLMAGAAVFNWNASGSTILPGAICEHLTSTGGTLRQGAGQTPLTDFLRAGAAGASGTVVEPYAIQAKFPTPMIHVHYARGASLAEAFYQSVAGPYQLLIVGDPLCAPWAQRPQVRVDGIHPNQTIRGVVTIKPSIVDAKARAIKQFELFIDGVRADVIAPGSALRVDTQSLADGFHEIRLVAVVDDAVETQERLIVPITINNHGRRARISVKRSARRSLDQTIPVDVFAPGAASIEIRHHGRTLATIDGPRGSAAIDARMLGIGRAKLQAVARFAEDPARGGDRVASEPITLTIQPPHPLAPARSPRGSMADGLLLTRADGEDVVIDDTRSASWLTDAGVGPQQPFTLTGWVKADRDDLYQLQVRSPLPLTLEVDGRSIPLEKTPRWQYLPLSLAAGWHELRIECAPDGAPMRLDLRFGRSGTRSPNGREFKHPAG